MRTEGRPDEMDYDYRPFFPKAAERPDCKQCDDPRPARWEGRLNLGGELVPLCDAHADAETIGPIARLS